MKTISTLLIFTCFFLQCNSVFTQDEKNGQKWYCYEETILPSELNEYYTIALEMVQLCKENDFPFSFHTWLTEDFKYQLWTPIESLDDIDKINKSWEKLLQNWDKEKIAKFRGTKISNYSATMEMHPDLTYEPENPRLESNEVRLCEWREYYLQTEKLDVAIEVVKNIREKLISLDYDNGWYFGLGGLGYEDPCLISWSLYKDEADKLAQTEKFAKMNAEDVLKAMNDLIPCIRTSKTIYMIYIPELSYVKE